MTAQFDSGPHALISLLLAALWILGPPQYDPHAPRVEAAIDLLASVRRRVLLADPEAFEEAR